MSYELQDLQRRLKSIEDKQQFHEQLLRHIEAVVLDIQRRLKELAR